MYSQPQIKLLWDSPRRILANQKCRFIKTDQWPHLSRTSHFGFDSSSIYHTVGWIKLLKLCKDTFSVSYYSIYHHILRLLCDRCEWQQPVLARSIWNELKWSDFLVGHTWNFWYFFQAKFSCKHLLSCSSAKMIMMLPSFLPNLHKWLHEILYSCWVRTIINGYMSGVDIFCAGA